MGGGGVTGAQKNQAAAGQAGIAGTAGGNMGTQNAQFTADQGGATNFYNNQMTQGLPFYRNLTDYSSGTTAQAFAPQRAAILRQTNQYANMPSGYRDALLTSLGAQQGRAFDQSLTQNMMANYLAKQQGAAGLTGQQQLAGNQALGYGGLATGANQSILQAPQAPSTLGTIGGLALGGLQAASGLSGGKGLSHIWG